ncbi:methyltransferase domain-containing protein [Bacillus sp. HMF5848]|nr:methyltransferase domain-containing protein [Bacillus sp. HMF5848]
MCASFHFYEDDILTVVSCSYNTTIRTNPYRINVSYEDRSIWALSLYAYLFYSNELAEYRDHIVTSLKRKQDVITRKNERSWNQNTYDALVNRFGEPDQAVSKILENPEWKLHPFYKYMLPVEGKNILHLLGSNGLKAIALSLLGANVEVVDFSQENKKYATKAAAAAQTHMTYILSDVLSYRAEQQFDIIFMELGVLHYFISVEALFSKVYELLNEGGKFILHEFHPISTKLITSKGKKHKVTGNYFEPIIFEEQVAFTKHLSDVNDIQVVLQRKWTLGEIITAAATVGLRIDVLEEEPNHKVDDIGLPKTFTLVAKK